MDEDAEMLRILAQDCSVRISDSRMLVLPDRLTTRIRQRHKAILKNFKSLDAPAQITAEALDSLCFRWPELDRTLQMAVAHINHPERRFAVNIQLTNHFLEQILSLFDELPDVVIGDKQATGERWISQTPGCLRYEARVPCNIIQMRLDFR